MTNMFKALLSIENVDVNMQECVVGVRCRKSVLLPSLVAIPCTLAGAVAAEQADWLQGLYGGPKTPQSRSVAVLRF